ncbi:hypothetical protein PanWU01x14_234960, partial [Parasponia andersonii]
PSTLVCRSLVDRFTGAAAAVVDAIESCCCCCWFFLAEESTTRVAGRLEGWDSDLVAMASEASTRWGGAVEAEVEEDEFEEEEEEEEEDPAGAATPPAGVAVDPWPWGVLVVVVRPAWMEMEPMKGLEDLPSKGTTN